MKNIIILLLACFVFSCKKNSTKINYPQGTYVEETLRLDTMDFSINNLIDASSPVFEFKQRASFPLLPFPAPGYMNSLYDFRIKNNSTIDLRSMLQSSSNFFNYYFNWQSNNPYFEIDKFFIRDSLPARVKFVKL